MTKISSMVDITCNIISHQLKGNLILTVFHTVFKLTLTQVLHKICRPQRFHQLLGSLVHPWWSMVKSEMNSLLYILCSPFLLLLLLSPLDLMFNALFHYCEFPSVCSDNVVLNVILFLDDKCFKPQRSGT